LKTMLGAARVTALMAVKAHPVKSRQVLEADRHGGETAMVSLQRKAVVGDIGGTHARFGIIDIDELGIDQFVSFECASFSSLQAVLSAYLRSVPHHPKTISLAIAGPVTGGAVSMTNLAWSTTEKEIAAIAGTRNVCLINDFEALALALPYLRDYQLEQIGGNHGVPQRTKVVLGAGTGLGVAGLVGRGDRWTALPGEGGHIAFAPQTELDFEIVTQASLDLGFVSAEHMLSGAGLVRLHRFLQTPPVTPLTPAAIVTAASSDADPLALRAVNLFATWYGRFAGDLALLYGARGGVYLGGGIAPKILPFLNQGGFRRAFEAKGAFSNYLTDIPIFVIKSRDAGLMGAALACQDRLDTD